MFGININVKLKLEFILKLFVKISKWYITVYISISDKERSEIHVCDLFII